MSFGLVPNSQLNTQNSPQVYLERHVSASVFYNLPGNRVCEDFRALRLRRMKGIPTCHSREGGNPRTFDGVLDPCLRRGDKVRIHNVIRSRPDIFTHTGNLPSDIDTLRSGGLQYRQRALDIFALRAVRFLLSAFTGGMAMFKRTSFHVLILLVVMTTYLRGIAAGEISVSKIRQIDLAGDDIVQVEADPARGFNFPFYLFVPA
ncbi:MAG: hypothetical protein ACYSWO_24475, partial [Planctomycetota bacterium]